jgi:hypothetical protein
MAMSASRCCVLSPLSQGADFSTCASCMSATVGTALAAAGPQLQARSVASGATPSAPSAADWRLCSEREAPPAGKGAQGRAKGVGGARLGRRAGLRMRSRRCWDKGQG